MPKDKRFWFGKCGHVLGEIRTVVYGKREVKALAVYEQSLAAVPSETPVVRAVAIGSLDRIRCTMCGETRDWIIGEDAIESLLEHHHQALPEVV